MLLQELLTLESKLDEANPKLIKQMDSFSKKLFPLLIQKIVKDFGHIKHINNLKKAKIPSVDTEYMPVPSVEFKVDFPKGWVTFGLTLKRQKKQLLFSLAWFDNNEKIEIKDSGWKEIKFNENRSDPFGDIDIKYLVNDFYNELHQELLDAYGEKPEYLT